MNLRTAVIAWWAFAGHARNGDWTALRLVQRKAFSKFLTILLLPAGLLVAVLIRAIRPWCLVRISILTSERIGHLAANTELYLCEHDAGINTPKQRFVDLWYHNWPVSNRQLARMFGRVIHVGPNWLLAPTDRMNSLIRGGDAHRIPENTQLDRDVHNLLDRFPPHLSFLADEESKGQAGLRELGIPAGAPFVCLAVRDGAYLRRSLPWKDWGYHDYRNCDIQDFIPAALELAKRGYYVIRMGAVAEKTMNVSHPMILDYAANGTRSDFMDVYLGARCTFCISTGHGIDAVPYIFRRPIVYVDHVPLGILMTFSGKFLATTKKHWLRDERRNMTLREIFATGAAHFYYSGRFEDAGIELVPSTPEEIAEVVLEMESRLKGTWQATEEDEALQRRFWDLYPNTIAHYNPMPMHGEFRSRVGADFLRRHKTWLE